MLNIVKEAWERTTDVQKVGFGLCGLGIVGLVISGSHDGRAELEVKDIKKQVRIIKELTRMKDELIKAEAMDDQIMVEATEKKISRFKKIYGI
jgi:hypothetical protein